MTATQVASCPPDPRRLPWPERARRAKQPSLQLGSGEGRSPHPLDIGAGGTAVKFGELGTPMLPACVSQCRCSGVPSFRMSARPGLLARPSARL
eukprot:5666786-Alexandrium_andersonii.AAC.1